MTDDFLRAVVDRRERPRLWASSWRARTPEDRARARLVRLADAARSEPADLAVLAATHGLDAGLGGLAGRVRWADARPTGEVARYGVDHPAPPITRICAVDFADVSGIATATGRGRDGIRIWRPGAEEPVATITRTGDDVGALTGLRSGGATFLAAGLRDGRVLVWRLRLAGEQVAVGPILERDLGVRVTAMCALPGPSGDRLACGGQDGRVALWSAAGTAAGGFAAHGGAVTAMAALGRDHLVTVGADRAVRVWDGSSGTPYDELAATDVRALCAWDGTVAFASPGTITLWTVDTGDSREFPSAEVTSVGAVPFGGTTLLAAAGDEIHFRDPVGGAVSGAWGAPSFNEGWCTYAEAACPVRVDGRVLLATGCRDGALRLYDPAEGIPGPGPSGAADGLCLLSVEQRPYAVAVGPGGVRFWDVETGAISGAIELAEAAHDVCVVPLPGRTLLACAGPTSLRLVDPYQGAVVREMSGPTNRVCSVTVDGQAMVASTGEDGTVRLWDPIAESPGRVLFTGRTPTDALCPVPFEGRELLAYACFEKVLIVDPSTGDLHATLDRCGANALKVFVYDGRTMLAGAPFEFTPGGPSVHLWDVAAAIKEDGPAAPVATFGGQVVRSEDLCPVELNGRTLIAAVHPDQWVTLSLWDPAEPTAPLREYPLFQAARRVESPSPGTLVVALANGVVTLNLG
ncbi:hypothetical protein AB0M54_46550 [Actinoplanes sp. NPDC051470]|uniref:WD40 repeat domain-containing protein n=1 Tax=Actinoplanes sp. NPDC051470 TaxID=3157224 RepID=UPI003430F045